MKLVTLIKKVSTRIRKFHILINVISAINILAIISSRIIIENLPKVTLETSVASHVKILEARCYT